MQDAAPVEWSEYWQKAMGLLPHPMVILHDMNPSLEEHYRSSRAWVYQDREDGLTSVMKRLLTIASDVIVGNQTGATAQLRAAIKEGLTQTQLAEVLTIVIMVHGMNTWAGVGHRLWEEYRRLQASGEAQ